MQESAVEPKWMESVKPEPAVVLSPGDVWGVMVDEGRIPETKEQFEEAYYGAAKMLSKSVDEGFWWAIRTAVEDAVPRDADKDL